MRFGDWVWILLRVDDSGFDGVFREKAGLELKHELLNTLIALEASVCF